MKKYGLIGYPLGHSFSKKYFKEKFEREGLKDCFFEAYPISSIELFPSLLLEHPELKGLSVTIPYKEKVLAYTDIISEEVQEIGATNSIKIQDGKLIARNTDVIGFEVSFQRLLQPIHTKAIVLGTGGASKAVQYVLKKMGIAFLVVSRNAHPEKSFIQYNELSSALISSYTILINCSPVGTWPNANECPDIPYEAIGSQHYLFDLVYQPAETLFLKKGMERGAVVQNGYDMLTIQAEASWEIWNS